MSYRKITELIGRSASTVCREINRNRSFMNVKPAYYPHTAQKKYLLRRSYCHRGMYWNEEVIAYIDEKLKATWSPEQISCTPCDLKMPSPRVSADAPPFAFAAAFMFRLLPCTYRGCRQKKKEGEIRCVMQSFGNTIPLTLLQAFSTRQTD